MPPLALSADGQRGAGIIGNKVSLWDLTTGKQIKEFAAGDQPLSALALSGDGKRIAVRDHQTSAVNLWDDNGRNLGLPAGMRHHARRVLGQAIRHFRRGDAVGIGSRAAHSGTS